MVDQSPEQFIRKSFDQRISDFFGRYMGDIAQLIFPGNGAEGIMTTALLQKEARDEFTKIAVEIYALGCLHQRGCDNKYIESCTDRYHGVDDLVFELNQQDMAFELLRRQLKSKG